MKLGVVYPQTELRGDPAAVRQIGLAVEATGWDFLVAYDHVVGAPHDREPKLTGPYTDAHPFHDPLVMFACLAGLTSRIELVTGVLILPQRQTVLVARQAADVDLLSGGRLRLGVGLGWNYVEYDALGQDFATRGRRLSEQVPLLRRLWSEPLVDFAGQFDAIDRAALNPRPARPIPLWLGGFAEPALRRAAAMGDGFMFSDAADKAHEQVPRLREFVAAAGRDPAKFGLQLHMLAAKTPEAVVATALRWRDLGGSHAAVNTMGMGFATAGAHLDYAARVRDALAAAGLA